MKQWLVIGVLWLWCCSHILGANGQQGAQGQQEVLLQLYASTNGQAWSIFEQQVSLHPLLR